MQKSPLTAQPNGLSPTMDSKTVYLIDLDGTILKANPFFVFANIFYILKNFFPVLGFKTFRIVTAAMKALLENNGPSTNFDLLTRTLTEQSRKDLSRALWNFYRRDFPKLGSMCSPITEAATKLRELKAKGHALYLTTNPIWPEECVHLRLKWAGLEPGFFNGITHSQNWHSCKPNVRYYREILERWQLDPKNCVLIGDNVRKEGPAAELGIKVLILNPQDAGSFWRNLSGNQKGL